jgi:hypothetical protein
LERFSEDLDLFLNPESFNPPLTARGIDRELKRLRDAVALHPGLTYEPEESRTIGGLGREDVFRYTSRFAEIPGIPTTVKFEAGIQSGAFPVETVMISSFAADRLKERGLGSVAEDLEPFPMSLLHFRRTFVEKLFTVHGKVGRLKSEGERLRRGARHYADLYVLAGRPEVLTMIESAEYLQIRTDYDQKSIRFFKNRYRPPNDLRFSASDAIFLPGELRALVEEDYYADVRLLFRDELPSFDAVIAELQRLAEKL